MSQLSLTNTLEQKSNHSQRILSEIALGISKQFEGPISAEMVTNMRINFDQQKIKFLELYSKEGYIFSADAPKGMILKVLSSIDKITTSSAGNKLKNIARIKN